MFAGKHATESELEHELELARKVEFKRLTSIMHVQTIV